MTDVIHACAAAVARELHFFDRMQDAKRPPFQTGHGWRKVDGGSRVLAARCWQARIIWAKAVLESLYEFFQVSRKTPKPNRQIRHLTLAIDDFCVPKGQHMPTERLNDMLSILPPHWSIFGCFEAGFFYNLSPIKGVREPAFSWHAHMFVWGVSLPEIEATIAEINSRMGGVAGLPAAVQTGVGDDLFARKASYLFKPPIKQYHVMRPLPGPDGRPVYRVRHRTAWPANLVRSWRQLRDRRLDELAFGASAGSEVLRRVKGRAAEMLALYEES